MQNEAISVTLDKIELCFSSGSFAWMAAIDDFIKYAREKNNLFENSKKYIDIKIPKRTTDFFHTVVEPLNWLRTYILYVELGNSTHYQYLDYLSKEYDKIYGDDREESTTYEEFETLIYRSRMIVDHIMLITYVTIWSAFECDLSVLYDKYNRDKSETGYISVQKKIDKIYKESNIKKYMKEYCGDINRDKKFLKAAANYRNTIHNNGMSDKKIVIRLDEGDIIINKNETLMIPRGEAIQTLLPVIKKIYDIYIEIISSYICYTSDEQSYILNDFKE